MSPPAVCTLAPGSTRRRLGSGSGSLGASKGRLVFPVPCGNGILETGRSWKFIRKYNFFSFQHLVLGCFRMSFREETTWFYKSRILSHAATGEFNSACLEYSTYLLVDHHLKIRTKRTMMNLWFTCQFHRKLSRMVLQSYTSYKTSNINDAIQLPLCCSYGLDQRGNQQGNHLHYPTIPPWSWQSNEPVGPVVLASTVDCCDWESCGRSSKWMHPVVEGSLGDPERFPLKKLRWHRNIWYLEV